MTTYVALLRGINVGGNKKVPMAVLKKALEKAGFENVRTLLASGNVVLESKEKTPAAVRTKVEKVIEDTFGFGAATIVRTMDELLALSKKDPFAKITVTPEIRLYVSFLGAPAKTTLKLPASFADGGYVILGAHDGEVLSVVDLSKGAGTLDAMAELERTFGKDITTRNWNTVQKIVALA